MKAYPRKREALIILKNRVGMAGLLDARARPQQVAITGIQLALETYTNIKYIKIKMPVVESIPEEKRGVDYFEE